MFGKLFSSSVNRRELFSRSALLSFLWNSAPAVRAASGGLQVGKTIYESIGVRPLINARGTFTIISGSLMLPEARAAMAAASEHYVHIDELMDAIGARLAELTKAEWGMITSGCSAALTHATTACVAGGNPDLHVRIPDLTGFEKSEVIIPTHSRNVYDAAVRSVGVRVLEASTVDEFEAALGPKTAMVYILAGPQAETGPLAFPVVAKLAAQRRVPVLVDAAAETLTIPNVHLERGASLVAYSGGKCIRGPQTAGLLLGRKDLVRAAWVESAPHHGFGRAMKVGKEEAVAMLMAVEMWVKRDHKAEWQTWMAWLNDIRERVTAVPGVTAAIAEPTELSNHTPTLNIHWDAEKFGYTGTEVADLLFRGEPRIAVAPGGRGGQGQTGIGITAYMMMPGDDRVVGERITSILKSPRARTPEKPLAPAGDLNGRWDVRIEYAAGSATHHLYLKQNGNRVEGTHQGNFVIRDLTGRISGDDVTLHSSYSERHGDSLNYRFKGKMTANNMTGTLDMGEYLGAKWTATRHAYRED